MRPFPLNYPSCFEVSAPVEALVQNCRCRCITMTEDQTWNKSWRTHQVSAFLDLKESPFIVSLVRKINCPHIRWCQPTRAQGFYPAGSYCGALTKNQNNLVQIVIKSSGEFLQIVLNHFNVLLAGKYNYFYFFSGHLRLTLLALYINVLMIIKKNSQ